MLQSPRAIPTHHEETEVLGVDSDRLGTIEVDDTLRSGLFKHGAPIRVLHGGVAEAHSTPIPDRQQHVVSDRPKDRRMETLRLEALCGLTTLTIEHEVAQ